MFAHEPQIKVEEEAKQLGIMRDFTFHHSTF